MNPDLTAPEGLPYICILINAIRCSILSKINSNIVQSLYKAMLGVQRNGPCYK